MHELFCRLAFRFSSLLVSVTESLVKSVGGCKDNPSDKDFSNPWTVKSVKPYGSD